MAVIGQQGDSLPKWDDAREFEGNLPADDLRVLDGQVGRDVAAAGVDSDEPASPDPCDQGTDREYHGQAELDGRRLAIVHQEIDRRALGHGDLVRGQVDEFDAARNGHGASGGGDDLTVFPPTRYQETDRVGIQKIPGRTGGLADGCLAERGWNVPQGAV